MSTPGSTYQRMPGRRQGIFFGASLWLAGDHLLSVQSWRFHEEYRRFYLRDIQSISLTRCRSFAVPVWLPVSLVVLFFAALAVRMLWSDALWAWLWIVVGALCWWLVVSLNFSCRVTLKTAASTVTLRSLYRVGAARRFLAAVEPKIAEAQGPMPEGWTTLETPVAESAPAGPATPAAEALAPAGSPLWTTVPAGLMAVALAASGAFAYLDLRSQSTVMETIGSASTAVVAILGVWLLVRRLQKRAPLSLAVAAMSAALLAGGLAWAKQFFPTMELLVNKQQPDSLLAAGTASYRLLQTMTAVFGIVAACVVALVALWRRAGDPE